MEKLSGGKVIRFDPTRPTISPNANPPFFKAWLPGSLWISSGACSLLVWAAEAQKLGPHPTHGEVFVRQVEDGTRYIGLAVQVLDEARKVEFRWGTYSQSIVIRGLGGLFDDADFDMALNMVYRMTCHLVEDEEYGICVVAAWTNSEAEPVRSVGDDGSPDRTPDQVADQSPGSEAAPGSQSD